jgi:hypothetical protein
MTSDAPNVIAPAIATSTATSSFTTDSMPPGLGVGELQDAADR